MDHPVVVDPEVVRAITGERIQVLQENREAWTRSFVEDLYRRRPSDEYLEAVIQAALSTPTTAALGPTDLGRALEALYRPVLFVYSSLEWAVAATVELFGGFDRAPYDADSMRLVARAQRRRSRAVIC